MKKLFDQFDLPLGLGGAAISGEGGGYGFGNVSTEQANEVLGLAFDLGIRLYDTAPIYGFGLSEQRLGNYFKHKREDVFFISKSGVDWHDSKRVNMTNDPAVTQKMLENSLRDLQSDYIDLYMIHWPDDHVDIRRPMEVLANAKLQGKVKHIGLCNTTIEDLERAQEVEIIEAVQSQLNPFDLSAVINLGDYLKKNNISFMSWGTLDKGILTQKVTKERTYDASDCRSWAPWWDKKEVAKKSMAMQKVFSFLDQHGVSGLEFAISHNLNFSICDAVLVGMKNPKYVETTVNAIKKSVGSEIVDEAKSILEKEFRKLEG